MLKCTLSTFLLFGIGCLTLKSKDIREDLLFQEQPENSHVLAKIIAESIENFSLTLEKNLETAEEQKILHERRKLYFFLCKMVISGVVIGGTCYALFNYFKIKFPNFNFKFPEFNFKLPDFGFGSPSNQEEDSRDLDAEQSCQFGAITQQSLSANQTLDTSTIHQQGRMQNIQNLNKVGITVMQDVEHGSAARKEVTQDILSISKEERMSVEAENLSLVSQGNGYPFRGTFHCCDANLAQSVNDQIEYARRIGLELADIQFDNTGNIERPQMLGPRQTFDEQINEQIEYARTIGLVPVQDWEW